MKTEKIIDKIRAGEMAIENDCEESTLKCLHYCFPLDDSPKQNKEDAVEMFRFFTKAYFMIAYWTASSETLLPTIKSTKLLRKIKKIKEKSELELLQERVADLEKKIAEGDFKTGGEFKKGGVFEPKNPGEFIVPEIRFSRLEQTLAKAIEALSKLGKPKEPTSDLNLPDGWKKEELIEWEEDIEWKQAPFIIGTRNFGNLCNRSVYLSALYEHKIIKDDRDVNVLISREKPTL